MVAAMRAKRSRIVFSDASCNPGVTVAQASSITVTK